MVTVKNMMTEWNGRYFSEVSTTVQHRKKYIAIVRSLMGTLALNTKSIDEVRIENQISLRANLYIPTKTVIKIPATTPRKITIIIMIIYLPCS